MGEKVDLIEQKSMFAFQSMAFDIFKQALVYTADPAALISHLTGRLREFTGAQTVIFFQCLHTFGGEGHRLVCLNPLRRKSMADSAEMAKLANLTCKMKSAKVFDLDREKGEKQKLLAKIGYRLSIASPLKVGDEGMGILLLLGLPDLVHIDQVISILDMLSSVTALAFRNALLHEKQEMIIENRTRDLRLHSSMIKQCSEGMAATDLEDRFLFVNKAFAAMHGYTPDALIGKHVSIFHTPEQIPAVEAAYRKVKERGMFKGEIWRVRKNDTPFLGYMHKSLLQDEADRPIGFIETLRDITEQKAIEQALIKEKEKAQRYLDIAGVMFVAIDADERVSLINKKGAELFGYREDEIIGKNWFDTFIPEENRDKVKAVFKKMMAGGIKPAEYFENPVLTKAGRERIIAWHNTPLYDEKGRIIGILASGEDITERIRAEKALQTAHSELEKKVTDRTRKLSAANLRLQELDRLKSMFITSMSHELRTPLNSIIGFTGIILMGMTGEINNEQKKQLTIVKKSAKHLLSLINDIIDVSKIEAGKFVQTIEVFDLSSLIREVRDIFSSSAAKRGLTLSLKLPERLSIESDQRRIKQVLVNLVGNALKFTDKGGVEIQAAEMEGSVQVSVKDTGIGIKREDMNRLFMFFSRITRPTLTIREGTGLGLYISKKIVEVLGGCIWAKSTHGWGSEFIFSLPLKKENE